MAIIAHNKIEKISSHELGVSLRLLAYSDRNAIRKWLADPYIIHLTFVVPGPDCVPLFPLSAAASDQYVNTLISDSSRLTFAIEVNGIHIGNIGLKEYYPHKQTSEFFIEIGEAEYRGKGVGKAAIAILLDYAFFTLGIQEMRLEVLEFNDVAIRVYRRLGFEITHRSGWHYDVHGQYWQVWAMNLAKERWLLSRRQLALPSHLVVKSLAK